MANNTAKTFDLDVLRGARWVATYHYRGKLADAKLEAKRALEVHTGAVVAILDSGLNVGTVR